MADPYAAIARRLGGTLRGRRRLTGGVCADVWALDIERPDGAPERVVVRQHHLSGPRAVAPHVTAAEHRLLGLLADRGLPVPRPTLLDETCEALPGPFLVMPFVEGTTEIAPDALPDALRQMARFMARLHRLDVAADALPPLPERRDPTPGAARDVPRRFEAAHARLDRWGPAPAERVALLHGDLWSGNILWRGGRIAAVIDWEDAAVGDPVADVATARTELVWAHGPAAAEAFTAHYVAAAGHPIDPLRLAAWELCSAAGGLACLPGWGLEPGRERRIRRAWSAWLEDAARRFVAGG